MASSTVKQITIERVERALSVLARVMEMDGQVYAPLYERLEREVEILKRKSESAPAPVIVVPPEEYFPEDVVLTKWRMLKGRELRRARRTNSIEFYAFQTGPHYTAKQIQDYINGAYLRKAIAPSSPSSPVPDLPRLPGPATTADDDRPLLQRLPPDLAAKVAEEFGNRIRRRRPSNRRRPKAAE